MAKHFVDAIPSYSHTPAAKKKTTNRSGNLIAMVAITIAGVDQRGEEIIVTAGVVMGRRQM